jgi:general secretion pathway protein H
MFASRAIRADGFTMLELVIVLLLMGLMLLIVPRYVFTGVSAADLRASSRDLAAGLRQARSEAVLLRRETTLNVDLEKRNFALSTHAKVHQLPEALELKLFTAQSEVVNEKQGAIRFFPDGSSTGGRITVASGERKYLVEVDWLTGKVSIAQ